MNISPDRVRALYIQWLRGASLRQLGRQEDVSHNVIVSLFKRAFGAKATNVVATSLARTLLADYPDDDTVLETALALIGTAEDVKHRSQHSLNQLSVFQTPTKEGILDTIAVSSLDPWDYVLEQEYGTVPLDFLRLPLFILTTDGLTRSLYQLLADTSENAA